MTNSELREYMSVLSFSLTVACLIIGAEVPFEFSAFVFALAIASAALFDFVWRIP